MTDHPIEKLPARPFLYLKVVALILLVTVFTVVLEHLGWLRGFEMAALDSWARVRLHLAEPRESSNIIIVTISDDDYKDIFASKSPLAADGVAGLINAISAAQPAVLGVDLDTSDEVFKSIKISENVPTIWATDSTFDKDGKLKPPLPPVLGGRQPQPPLTGVAALPIDSDGIIRAYVRKFESHNSFQWTITKTYCSRVKDDPLTKAQLAGSYATVSARCDEVKRIDQEPAEEEELSLDLLGDRSAFQHFTARKILDAYQTQDAQTLARLKGAVVLLGGVYYAARDEYTTPVGRMAGVELTAHAIDSELRGGGFRRPAELLMVALNVIGGIIILVLFVKLGLGKGCLISGLLMVFFAPLWSLIAFHSFAYTFYFLIIFGAVLVHQLYEQAHYYQHEAIHRASKSQAATRPATAEPPSAEPPSAEQPSAEPPSAE